jgi:hypothetical protein
MYCVMSTTSSVSTSSSFSYAIQLAETSKLKRSLNGIGSAIEDGDLTSASSKFNALMKANPDYAKPSSSDDSGTTSGSKNSINDDFQAVAKALDAKDADAAKKAWAQLKSDLADSGVTDISDGKAATAKLLAQTKASINQAILSNAFGVSSSGSSSITSLIGTSSSDYVSSAISNWLTYEADGSTSSDTGSSSSRDSALDTKV